MDTNTLTTAGVGTAFTVLAGIGYKIFRAVNHKQCKSKCCGKEMDMSLAIDEMPPTTTENPMKSKPKEEV